MAPMLLPNIYIYINTNTPEISNTSQTCENRILIILLYTRNQEKKHRRHLKCVVNKWQIFKCSVCLSKYLNQCSTAPGDIQQKNMFLTYIT